MPQLSEISDRPLAIDLRIDLTEAARLRAPAAAFSLWPDAPFGASADIAVWPSVFVPPDHAATDRIALTPGQAPTWDAFAAWDDLRDLSRHLRPLPMDSVLVALALHPADSDRVDPDYVTGQMLATGLTAETLASKARCLGYDLTDRVLSSALFDAARLQPLDVADCPRTGYGLLADADTADRLRKVLERDDPSHAPLLRVSVWSLGARTATSGVRQ